MSELNRIQRMLADALLRRYPEGSGLSKGKGFVDGFMDGFHLARELSAKTVRDLQLSLHEEDNGELDDLIEDIERLGEGDEWH